MTGYGVGFPRHSKYKGMINQQLMEYRENGDLERLQRFWFAGACNKPMNNEKQSRSDPLALEQFFSTFLLLGSGILLSGILLLLERIYCRCRFHHLLLHQPKARYCCALISKSLGKTLDPETEKVTLIKHIPGTPPSSFAKPVLCQSPGCEELLARMEEALGAAQRRVAQLEADLQLHASTATCKVHGPRVRPRSRSLAWSWGHAAVHSSYPGLREELSGSPRTFCKSSEFCQSHDFCRSSQDVARDYSIGGYGVWPPTMKMFGKEIAEIETVL